MSSTERAGFDSQYDFVELSRTFHEISPGSDQDDLDFSNYFSSGSRLEWSDVLEKYRVVLLSEAGSGKTEEIRHVANRLKTNGKAAFFLRLEHLAHDFEDAFEVGSVDKFEEWLSSEEEGWLLLDSVDEARLRSPIDFELAIRKLGNRISAAKDRSHIIITGRTSAWRPKSDLALCHQHLPFASQTDTVELHSQETDIDSTGSVQTVEQTGPKSKFKLIALDDLNKSQIALFLQARGITDTSKFLDAVERADAWSFTARPQDLEELSTYWIDERSIGSRLEILQNSIDRRLKERDQNHADTHPLSVDFARKGAQRLAAATTLGQNSRIGVPDGSLSSGGISVKEVLPEWGDNEQATLLSRPVFDEAIYGTVRFHHRSVRELLTAEWFAELLKRHTSRRKIDALFFRNQYGHDVVAPVLRPILPWLAILDERVCQSLQVIAPEVFFEGGDPSRLPIDTRRALLHKVCGGLVNGASLRSVTDYAAAQRFAGADLAEDVCRLIETYRGNDNLTAFLLRMVWLGRIGAALPKAKDAALCKSLSEHSRIAAFRAVKAIGSEQDCNEIRASFLQENRELNREWLAELIKDIVPSSKAVDWLLAALAKSAEKDQYKVDHLQGAVNDFVQEADNSLLPKLIFGLDELLRTPPAIEKRYCEVSEKFAWLLVPAAQSVERLIQGQHPAALENSALSILHKLRLAKDYVTDVPQRLLIEIAKIVPTWAELNRALFWHDIEQARAALDKKNGERLVEYRGIWMFGAFWRFNEGDFEYVASQIPTQRPGDNRLVALSLAFQLYRDNGRPRKWRERLKNLVCSDSELSDRLSNYLRPPAQSEEERKLKRQEAVWKRRAKEQKLKEQKNREKWKSFLSKNKKLLRTTPRPDQITNAQYYLHEQMREKEDESNRWTNGNWKVLIEEYGERVAQAFRDGVVAFWRGYKPQLRSEGASPNQTPLPVIFGLTGLSIEARENEQWLNSLSEEEVNVACCYSSHELNGFPTWFPKLFKKQPRLVGEFLLKEIRFELSMEKSDTNTHYILSDISWTGDWAWDELAPQLLGLLSATEPKNLENLQMLLMIAQGASIDGSKLKELAKKKCRSLRRLNHLAMWYAVWAGVAPAEAIPEFAKRVARVSRQNDRTTFAMSFVTNLLGGRRLQGSRARKAFMTPQHLKTLYLLMLEHIRIEDDIDRVDGGIYSPGLRDDAQESREALLSLLKQIPGKEAFLALMEIAKQHPDQTARPWIARNAKMKAEQDADLEPWTPLQVNEFQDLLERTPANHRELADLAVMRMLDLKDDIEHGDSSISQLLRRVRCENEMRNYIGHELRQTASGRYSIPQEEELADAKRSDIRFHGVGFDGPVPAELKLADNWTGPKLFERLENQLCGDYLRDNRSKRGLFVLIYLGSKDKWEIPDTEQHVGFSDLVDALGDHWQEISGEYPGVDDITVIGIDLTTRAS